MSKFISDISRKPFFWILQVIVFVFSTLLAIHFYPKAFPVVDLRIQMDRVGALQAARKLAENHHWGPSGFKQAASFDSDGQTQTFIELTNGGSEGFSRILKEGLYAPYTWRVRHFSEGKTNETYIRFTPQGELYGFQEVLAETEAGAALPVEQALKIAETSAKNDWKIDFSSYKLVEKSQETAPSRRIDHFFTYERLKEKIGDGTYRLRLSVSGDRLTELTHFVKIPDGFLRRYAEMRSANDTVASISSISMIILYFLGGCGLGIFYLARKHWVLWKTPLLFAGVVAAFQFLEQLNHFPLVWMRYDTAISSTGFILQNLSSAFITFILEFLLLSISFMAAESLTRKGFPNFPQFWKIWRPENGSTKTILGQTLGGYLSVGFFFAFVVMIYFVGTRHLGWWSPSDILFNPDGLATYCPWFTAIASSLHAGFWEECLFRAVPLAGAAVLGERFGHKKKWITAAFLVQALIFAAAHANYPAQPYYARVVELIIPSFIFGGLYLAFGLLPGIILHFTFDVVSFSIPIFSANTPHIWIDRGLTIFFTLVPLWIILGVRLRTGRWLELKPKEKNGAWTPANRKASRSSSRPQGYGPLSRPIFGVLILFGALSFALLGTRIQYKNQTWPLQIHRKEAVSLARKTLEEMGVQLSSHWESLTSIVGDISEDERFIWKTEGPEVFEKLTGSYLMPPTWMVRFVRFDTSVEERAEEYQIYLAKKGDVFRVRHELPEGRAGASLDVADARKIALKEIEKSYGLNAKDLKEVSSNASQLPHRRDWVFVFTDSAIRLKEGEARIGVRVAGDQAVSSRRFVFIPEEWSRKERNRQHMMGIVATFSSLVLILTFIAGLIWAIISWTRKNFETRAFWISFSLLSVLGLFNFINQLPAKFSHLSTQQPKLNQIITLFGFSAVKILFFAAASALLVGFTHRHARHRAQLPAPLYSLAGFFTGVIGATLFAWIGKIMPQELPSFGQLSALNTWIPGGFALNQLEKYVFLTLAFFVYYLIFEWITAHGTRRKGLGISFILLCALAMGGVDASNFSSWLATGALGFLYLWISIRFFIRSHLSLIPQISLGIWCLFEWKQISIQPHPDTLMIGISTMICIVLFSKQWQLELEKLARTTLKRPS